jgi:hypothetical protein
VVVVPSFQLALDGVKDRPGELLRDAFPDGAALDQQRSRAMPSGRSSKLVTCRVVSAGYRVDTYAAIGDPLISTRTATIRSLSTDASP